MQEFSHILLPLSFLYEVAGKVHSASTDVARGTLKSVVALVDLLEFSTFDSLFELSEALVERAVLEPVKHAEVKLFVSVERRNSFIVVQG